MTYTFKIEAIASVEDADDEEEARELLRRAFAFEDDRRGETTVTFGSDVGETAKLIEQ